MKYDPANRIQDLRQFGEFGDVNPSITDSSTYTFLKAELMEATFHGEAEGCFLYSRHWNPTNRYLAEAMAALEGTELAWITASGMAASHSNSGSSALCAWGLTRNYLSSLRTIQT